MNAYTEWLSLYFDEVTPMEFYRELFPEGELDCSGNFTKGKYVGIIIEKTNKKKENGKPLILRHSLTNELSKIEEMEKSRNFCLCAPISYAGKERTAENARFLYGIAVDLDKIRIKEDGTPQGLIDMWNGHIIRAGRIPRPTYIVSSGTGLHLYYFLEKPIPLFPDIARQLQKLKSALTTLIWNEGIVDIKDSREIQQEGIYQGFRMVGTLTKNGQVARAFLTGRKVDIDYLNRFVPEKSRVNKYTVKSNLTLSQAKEKYPEWYEKRIVEEKPRGVWCVSRKLYDWWKGKIKESARVGHRYYCLMTLAIYAQKCSMYHEDHNPKPVTREELESDCFEIMEYFETLTTDETNHFDEGDVLDALEAFDERWIWYPRRVIEYRSGIEIPPKKRNGRKRKEHIKLMNYIREEINGNKEWRNTNGRPERLQELVCYLKKNPGQTNKSKIAKELNMSRTTVTKWYEDAKKYSSSPLNPYYWYCPEEDNS